MHVIAFQYYLSSWIPLQKQCHQQVDLGRVESFALTLCLRVIWAGPKFHSTSQFTEVGDELNLKVPSLVQKDFLWQPVMDDKIVP